MFRALVMVAVLSASGCCLPFGLGDSGLDSAIVCFDRDEDGVETCFGARGDCNDFSADVVSVWGGAERCNGLDDDCDTLVDEGVGFFPDADGDGFGDDAGVHCAQASGDATVGGDCDDGAATAHPGATELCDGVDNDCDGGTDEGSTWYPDADGDGYGDSDLASCERLATEVGGDCDDSNAALHPGATELCNSLDDDCDGTADGDTRLWPDGDADGYGTDPSVVVSACAEGHSAEDGDCDDADATSFPGAVETCEDLADKNCDGSVGGDDADRDGYPACEDCDDQAWFVFPGATEICDDGIDEDCDTLIDEDC